MSTPAIIYIVLSAIGLGIVLEQHGKPKEGEHNAWSSILATILSFSLLFWGGFFK